MNPMSIKFTGPLAHEFTQFANQMKITCENHNNLFNIIRRFDRYLSQSHPKAKIITRDILSEWFMTFAHLNISSQRRYRSAIFQLCKYLHLRNPQTAVREEFAPLRQSRTFKPYIFSSDEILKLLTAARALAIRRSNPLRPWSMELIITLLYTTGLRIGEVTRLTIHDYDLKEGTLTIRKSKFRKSRLVPLSTSAKKIVDRYLNYRYTLGLSCDQENSLIWSPRTSGPSQLSIQDALYRLFRQCGLKSLRGREGPRIHDFRHSFAYYRILQWYKEEKDVQKLLPYLSIYMGHSSIESTQYYLSFIPSVLEKASKRFERFASGIIDDKEVEKNGI